MRFDNLANPLQHTLGLIHCLVIPETQHGETLPRQPRVPFTIIGDLIPMLAAVELDHPTGPHAGEVHDAGAKRLLALELQSEETMRTKAMPQALLGWGLRRPHGFGVVAVAGVHGHAFRCPPPTPLPQAGEGAFQRGSCGAALAEACCWPSDSLASSAMPAIAPITPVASIGSSSIFWLGEAAIAFSAST